MRTLVALAAVAALAAPAAAKRRPPPPPVSPVTATTASRPLAELIASHDRALSTCAVVERVPSVRARLQVRWDRTGLVTRVRVRGGSARFQRCVDGALVGARLGATRAGSARAELVVSAP